MVTEQDIKRINELYHKSKEGSGVYLKDIKNASKQSEQDAADAFDPKTKAQQAMAATDAQLDAEKAMAETDQELKEEK